MRNINDTVKERGSRYGEFRDNSETVMMLWNHLSRHHNFPFLDDTFKFAIFNILGKLSRAINGDEWYDDNPHDIVGYLQNAFTAYVKYGPTLKADDDLEEFKSSFPKEVFKGREYAEVIFRRLTFFVVTKDLNQLKAIKGLAEEWEVECEKRKNA